MRSSALGVLQAVVIGACDTFMTYTVYRVIQRWRCNKTKLRPCSLGLIQLLSIRYIQLNNLTELLRHSVLWINFFSFGFLVFHTENRFLVFHTKLVKPISKKTLILPVNRPSLVYNTVYNIIYIIMGMSIYI